MSARYEQKLISVYTLAKAYLIGGLDEVLGDNDDAAADILAAHLTPQECNRPENLADIYFHLLKHAQNANMKPRVIGGLIGGVENLGKVLFKFDYKKVLEHYGNNDVRLLDDIVEKLQPTGKVLRSSGSLWVYNVAKQFYLPLNLCSNSKMLMRFSLL